MRPPHISTLFPYTTLFRSRRILPAGMAEGARVDVDLVATRHEVAALRERVALAIAEALRSEEHTSELQSRFDLVCRLLLEKKKPQKEKQANYAVYSQI